MKRINETKSPREKLSIVLQSCKTIFNVLSSVQQPIGADDFLPVMIIVVLRANPQYLQSNISFFFFFFYFSI